MSDIDNLINQLTDKQKREFVDWCINRLSFMHKIMIKFSPFQPDPIVIASASAMAVSEKARIAQKARIARRAVKGGGMMSLSEDDAADLAWSAEIEEQKKEVERILKENKE